MKALQNLTLQAKLTAVLMLTSSIALVGACTAFVVYEWFASRNQVQVEIGTLAEIGARECTAPVNFDREEEVTPILANLSIDPQIVAACIYRQGQVYAKYPGTASDSLFPARPPTTNQGSFGPNTFSVTRQLLWPDGKPLIGIDGKPQFIYVRATLDKMYARLWRYVGIAVAVALFAAIVAYLIGARLRGLISHPILALANTARRVSEHKDYSARAAAVPSRDEVSVLVNSFNDMLVQIQKRDHELREARNAAERANQAKSAFLSFMSHELRTPLTAINGFSEMLIMDLEAEGRAEWREDVRRIHESGKYLLELINDILDLSKIEAGKMEVHVETFDVCRLIRELTDVLRPLIEGKRNRLVVNCPPTIGAMHADMIKVRQCLLNLLSNANKFTEQGTLTLTTERITRDATDWLIFRVQDTGIGMKPEHLQKLFRMFTQAGDRTSRRYGGTGLGLALTKQFCKMMHGDVSAQSQPGQGSTFTIELPASTPDQSGAGSGSAAPATPLAPPTRPPGDCLLSIDDDPAVHEFLREALQNEGYHLAFARSGPEGLRLAKELQPAIITLDVIMPEMDGWVVLALLKEDRELAHIPVIMLTVKEQQDFAFAMGVADYLHKPIDRDRLLATLEQHRRPAHPAPVLIVEDDPHMREMLRRMLERDDWQVAEAENGLVALEQIKRTPPAMIVLDLMMPVMDGFQMVAELQKHEDWRHIPIVVVSAKELSADDRRRLQGHVRTILQKGSFGREELMREVKQTVRLFLASQERSKH